MAFCHVSSQDGGAVAAERAIALGFESHDEDWGRLWWIRLRGRARVLDDGEIAAT